MPGFGWSLSEVFARLEGDDMTRRLSKDISWSDLFESNRVGRIVDTDFVQDLMLSMYSADELLCHVAGVSPVWSVLWRAGLTDSVSLDYAVSVANEVGVIMGAGFGFGTKSRTRDVKEMAESLCAKLLVVVDETGEFSHTTRPWAFLLRAHGVDLDAIRVWSSFDITKAAALHHQGYAIPVITEAVTNDIDPELLRDVLSGSNV